MEEHAGAAGRHRHCPRRARIGDRVLVGRPASSFQLDPVIVDGSGRASTSRRRPIGAGRRRSWRWRNIPVSPQVPVLPAGLPSELLERRPDVAAAERAVAASSARIGVAAGGLFPDAVAVGLRGLARVVVLPAAALAGLVLVAGAERAAGALRCRRARGGDRAGARRARGPGGQLPPGRAAGLQGGGGQPRRAAHPRRGDPAAGRDAGGRRASRCNW